MKRKLLFIFALLCAAVQGLWAVNGVYCTASDLGRVLCTDGSIYNNVSEARAAGRTAVAQINYVDEVNHKGLAFALQSESGYHAWQEAMDFCENKNNTLPVVGAHWVLPSLDQINTMVNAAGGLYYLRTGFSGVGGTDIPQVQYWTSTSTSSANARIFQFGEGAPLPDPKTYRYPFRACLEFDLLTLYTIDNTDEWKAFCEAVNNGDTFSDKYVQLTDNWISTLSTMAGTDDTHSFQGIFDGNGFTLTNNCNTANITGDYCAPLRHVKDAVIKNLRVNGYIYAAKRFASGIVGESHGDLIIVNCRSSVSFESSVTGDGTFGGLVSTLSGENHRIIIDHCVFDGQFIKTANTTNCAGFVGWPVYNRPTISNSIMKPVSVDAGMLKNTFIRKHEGTEPIITNCFYFATPNMPTNQGMEAFSSPTANEVCKQMELNSIALYSGASTVSGVEATYNLDEATEPVNVTPVVTDPYGDVLSLGANYTATLNGENVASFPIRLVVPGSFTLVITGKNDYTGSKTVNFTTTGAVAGETEAYPILINSASDWDTFADNVNTGANTYTGKYLYLNADISVSTMVGASDTNSFQGHFDGGDHTLTFTQGSSGSGFNEQYCAPFRYVNNATIKNLKTAGDIFTSQKFAAGLIARNQGTTNITNCHVSTVIHSSVSGDGTHGGIVAMPSNTLNITDCSFSGRLFTTSGTTDCGGFVGWHNSATNNITNSLYAPSADITPATGENAITVGGTFVRGGSPTITNCFYTEALGAAQGTLVYTSASDDAISQKMRLVDGNDYHQLCTTVSGLAEAYVLGESLLIEPTITNTSTSTVLTFGTDFTAALNGIPVGECPIPVSKTGDNTLTLIGIGNYGGSKSFTFFVGEYMPIIESSTTLGTQAYKVYKNVTINERITINGDDVTGTTLYLGEGTTLRATKGIELATGHLLTIFGPGTLIIDDCDASKSGIGAASMGVLTIRGGQLDITGADGAAGIGSDAGQTASGALTLGWSHAFNDYVNCNSYSLGNPILYSSQFVVEGQTTILTPSDNIDGKKIVPYIDEEITLLDGDTYPLASDKSCSSATYQKTLGEERVGKHQAWFVPFDYTIKADDEEKFDFYKINMIANAPAPGQDASDDVWVFLKKMSAGDMLHANMPYVYKPKEAVTDYMFTTTAATVLRAKTNDARITMMTAEDTYTLYGTYEPVTATAENPFYYVNINGGISLGNNGTVTVGAYRWIMRVENKFGGSPAYAREIHFYDGDATGINEANSHQLTANSQYYDLQGRKVAQPTKGLYIINGKKVVIR